MKEKYYNLENHPIKVARNATLDPNQKGLLVVRSSSLTKKKSGDEFEKNVATIIENAYSPARLINNVYFETGRYNSKLCLYESVQIDHILITDYAVFCIEDKYIEDKKCVSISGSALAKQWRVKNTRGTVTTEPNGLKQNYGHYCFLQELFEEENIEVPVIQLTVIGGVERQKIRVQQFIDANLVDTREILCRIKYLTEMQKRKGTEQLDLDKILDIIDKWRCKDSDIEKLHLVYLRNRIKNKLPKRCKKILRK